MESDGVAIQSLVDVHIKLRANTAHQYLGRRAVDCADLESPSGAVIPSLTCGALFLCCTCSTAVVCVDFEQIWRIDDVQEEETNA